MTRWGTGARYQICSVQMLAPLARPHPSLRATFPTRGKAFFGGTLLYVVPLSNGDPACWRPAWGGVRLCGNDWWSRVIFGGWCRFAQDDTVGRRGVVRNLFGANVSTVRPPSSGRSRLLAPRLGRGSLCGNGWWVRVILGGWCRFAQDDTAGYRGVIRSLFGVKYSTVKLTDTAFCFSSHSPATLCVISEQMTSS